MRRGEVLRDLVVRKRRHAAHEILYLLRLVREIVPRWFNFFVMLERDHFTRDQCVARIQSIAQFEAQGSIDPREAAWDALREALDGELTSARLTEVEDRARDYLAGPADEDPPGRTFTQEVTDALTATFYWSYVNLVSLLSVVTVAALFMFVEQVHGLFFNSGVDERIAVLGLCAAPVFGSWWWCRKARRDRKSLAFDVGGLPLSELLAQPRAPSRGLQRFLPGSGLERILIPAVFARLIPPALGCGAAVIAMNLYGRPAAVTTALVVSMLVMLVAVARALDALDFVTRARIRFQSLVVLVGLGFGLFYSDARWLVAAAVLPMLWNGAMVFAKGFGTAPEWSRVVMGSLQGAIAVWGCVVYFVAGNERWEVTNAEGSEPTEPTRVARDEWPKRDDANTPVVVMIASGGGSRAAIFTAEFLEQLHRTVPDVACGLQAIGSVSGGSLANAAYTSWRLKHDDCPKLPPRGAGGVGPLVDAVSGDFILPTIYGVFDPMRSRGRRVEDAFEAALGRVGAESASNPRLGEIAKRWKTTEDRVPAPLPLFHSASLERNVVVLSPLAADAFHDPIAWASARHANAYERLEDVLNPTWVYYRSASYALDDFAQTGFDPSLAQAVRASANFPFGFPFVTVASRGGLHFSPDRRRRAGEGCDVRLTDGGVLSNSGIWGMHQLLFNHIGALRERGLILLISEASKMPEYVPDDLYAAFSDKRPSAHHLHREMMRALQRALGGKLRVLQLDLNPDADKDNVMTTWVLPAARRQQLQGLFDKAWETAAPEAMLKGFWNGPRSDAPLCSCDALLDACAFGRSVTTCQLATTSTRSIDCDCAAIHTACDAPEAEARTRCGVVEADQIPPRLPLD